MFKSLKIKLVLLYTAMTGFIIITVLSILLIYTENILEVRRKETFQNNISTLVSKLKSENTISYTWLSQMESRNDLIIHIEDNGISLTFPGVLQTPTERGKLFEELNSLALREGIDTGSYPLFSNSVESSIFRLEGVRNGVYYGAAVILPTETGWRSLILLKYLPGYYSSIMKQRLLYLFLGVAGISVLYFINRYFVMRLLKPVEENNEKQTRFIASASHELRSPLTVIRANNSAIQSVSTETRKFSDGIERECERMARLINDMLLLASTDAKTWTLKKSSLETDTLLIETYEDFLVLCRQKGLRLNLEIPDYELPAINADRERLQQILSVLLDNAISYSPSDTVITIREYPSGSCLYIEVEDHGFGIPDKYKKQVFDRFCRIDPARNEKQHFGLGLSIAKELMHLHGGRITVRDTDGGGATFVLQFKV